jgi:mono/diheme cytochrome c family protein
VRGRLAVAILLALAGCDQNMSDQRKYAKYKAAELFGNQRVLQAAPAGTIARDALSREQELEMPPPLTLDLLVRGRERFEITCAPCHGSSGDGDGMIVQRGMPAPPSYHEARLRDADDRHFIDVITHGHGVMYSYATRVAPADRWAITAYIRALQLGAAAPAADLPAEIRARLAALPR